VTSLSPAGAARAHRRGLSRGSASALLQVGTCHARALTVQVLPFVSQDEYDRLLWCCDFNAVRGEDSFVRAQWAGQPMLWHIYVQDENAHWEKLEAFLAHYRAACQTMPMPPCWACGAPGTWISTWARPGRRPASIGQNCSSMPGVVANRPLSRTLPRRWYTFTEIRYDTRPRFL
jgi:hypothetical protein